MSSIGEFGWAICEKQSFEVVAVVKDASGDEVRSITSGWSCRLQGGMEEKDEGSDCELPLMSVRGLRVCEDVCFCVGCAVVCVNVCFNFCRLCGEDGFAGGEMRLWLTCLSVGELV